MACIAHSVTSVLSSLMVEAGNGYVVFGGQDRDNNKTEEQGSKAT